MNKSIDDNICDAAKVIDAMLDGEIAGSMKPAIKGLLIHIGFLEIGYFSDGHPLLRGSYVVLTPKAHSYILKYKGDTKKAIRVAMKEEVAHGEATKYRWFATWIVSVIAVVIAAASFVVRWDSPSKADFNTLKAQVDKLHQHGEHASTIPKTLPASRLADE